MKLSYLLLMLGLVTNQVYAQECAQPSGKPRKSLTQDFDLSVPNVATHKRYRLMWMRCAVGQSWQSGHCIGTAKSLSYAEALAVADTTIALGYNDWRVPSQEELVSIVEQGCTEPAINQTVFPDTPASWFWTSSSMPGRSGYALGVHYGEGFADYYYKQSGLQLRLVRFARG